MKVNLECNSSLLNGYVNVVPFPVEEQDIPDGCNIVVGRYNDLDPVLLNDSCEEIIFGRYLNKVDPRDMVKTLVHWNTKLQKDGIVKLTYINIRNLAESIVGGEMPPEDIHGFVFGGDSYEFRSIIDNEIIHQVLDTTGYKITFISNRGIVTHITARKVKDIDVKDKM